MATGYGHAKYARSLRSFGKPRELPRSGGWVLERPIPGFPATDAMGCYPLFSCQHWDRLHIDLNEIDNTIVTLTLVADPFGNFDLAYLQSCFDVVCPIKEHFVADLRRPINEIVTRKRCQIARRALKKGVSVERCQLPIQFIDEWVALYDTLVERHNITGIRRFSSGCFAEQLRVPGLEIFRALYHGRTIGAHWWYAQGEVAYSHLSAYAPLGYELRVAYALCLSAIEYFKGKVRWLDHGGGLAKADGTDGLGDFKRGWSTGIKTAYLCGRILDQELYREILWVKGSPEVGYFPAYRVGEFR